MSWITIVNDAVPWAWTQCDSVTIFENVDMYICKAMIKGLLIYIYNHIILAGKISYQYGYFPVN